MNQTNLDDPYGRSPRSILIELIALEERRKLLAKALNNSLNNSLAFNN